MFSTYFRRDRMVLISSESTPSWRTLLGYNSETAPLWYTAAREENDRVFWDAATGEGFDAWHLETQLESGKEPDIEESLPLQLFLPGFDQIEPPSGYLLNSF